MIFLHRKTGKSLFSYIITICLKNWCNTVVNWYYKMGDFPVGQPEARQVGIRRQAPWSHYRGWSLGKHHVCHMENR